MTSSEVVVQVRLLDGKTSKKSFNSTDKIDSIYEWLNSEHNTRKEEFQLLNSYPRQVLDESFRSKTLSQTGFSKQLTLVMSRPNAQQANKSKPIEANKGFFENLFGSDNKTEEKKKDDEPGFFDKLFGGGGEKKEDEPRRTVKDARTLADTDSKKSNGEIVDKKIKGMHSNVKGFK